VSDRIRVIQSVEANGTASVVLVWSDGQSATVDLSPMLSRPAFKSLWNPDVFRQVTVGDWGHSIRWPGGEELGADWLWLRTLDATGRADSGAFLRWRIQNGLSLTKAAEALGLSRRMVAYYSNGDKPVPRHILLACLGWEAHQHGVLFRAGEPAGDEPMGALEPIV
jgi:hypothetical protein